jgi:hypothetical protein
MFWIMWKVATGINFNVGFNVVSQCIVAYLLHAGAVAAWKLQGTRLCNRSGAPSSCALLPLPSPCFAPHRVLLGYVQQWGLMWSLWCHAQQYTMLRSPAYKTPAFIGETEGSSTSSVRVSVHTLVATESLRQFAAESSQPVRSQLSKSYRHELRRLLLWREDLHGIFGV